MAEAVATRVRVVGALWQEDPASPLAEARELLVTHLAEHGLRPVGEVRHHVVRSLVHTPGWQPRGRWGWGWYEPAPPAVEQSTRWFSGYMHEAQEYDVAVFLDYAGVRPWLSTCAS